MSREPWFGEAWHRLGEARRMGRLPHGLLLHGSAGLGLGGFARDLARSLLCEQPSGDGEACGACRSCRLEQAGNHPDLRRVSPEEEGKAIRVDQVRGLTDFLGMKSQLGGLKLAILEPAEAMNRNAANSLLKTLEEPTPGSVIVLVCHRLTGLPPTVRSRCQRIDFRPPDAGIARSWLADRLPEGTDAELLLGLAGGSPLAALTLAREEILEQRHGIVAGFLGLTQGKLDPVAVAGEWNSVGARRLLPWLCGLVEDLARLRLAGPAAELVNTDLRARLQALAKRLDLKRLFGAYQRLLEQRGLLESGSTVREQELLEDFTVYWVEEVARGGPAHD